MSDVVSLADKYNNGTLHSPEQALNDALKCLGEDGAFKEGKKLLILALDDTDGFNVSFIQAGMKMSECISLCEVSKTLFLSEMEYL